MSSDQTPRTPKRAWTEPCPSCALPPEIGLTRGEYEPGCENSWHEDGLTEDQAGEALMEALEDMNRDPLDALLSDRVVAAAAKAVAERQFKLGREDWLWDALPEGIRADYLTDARVGLEAAQAAIKEEQ